MAGQASHGALFLFGLSPSATAPASTSRGPPAACPASSINGNYHHHQLHHHRPSDSQNHPLRLNHNHNTNNNNPFSDLDNLTLPPIAHFDADEERELPPFFNNFAPASGSGALPPPAVTSRSNISSTSAPQRNHNHYEPEPEDEPPPSNQQAQSRAPPQPFQNLPPAPQYLPDSPDPFDDLFDPEPFADPFDLADYLDLRNSPSPDPVPSMPPSTRRNNARRSSLRVIPPNAPVIDLTDASTQTPASLGRKRRGDGVISEPKSKKPRSGASPGLKKEESVTPNMDGVEVVDLDGLEGEEYKDKIAKDQADLIKKQNLEEATKPVKLAEFNCIICMDQPTDLTITHCGHLFCSECLHQALYAGDKKCCPVCRTTINTTLIGRGEQKRPHKNGVFALEMKLGQKDRKGKQPVRVR